MLIVLFLVSHFNFLFVPCGGLSWLPVSFLLHVKYTVSYLILTRPSYLGYAVNSMHVGDLGLACSVSFVNGLPAVCIRCFSLPQIALSYC